jgi:DNA-binding NtrC family response regulator
MKGDELRGRAVLVVDDDPAACSAIARVLACAGAVAVRAYSVDEARQYLWERKALDAALVDVRLRGSESGFDVARMVSVAHPDAAVLMVTGDVDEEARALADDLALPLAAKPYDPADLVRLLAMLMQ